MSPHRANARLAPFSPLLAFAALGCAALSPSRAAQNTALSSGDWFDPSVWSASTPAHATDESAKLLIPAGLALNFNNAPAIPNLDALFDAPLFNPSSATADPATLSPAPNLPYYLHGSGDQYTAGNYAFSVGQGAGDTALNLTGGALGVADRVTVGVNTTAASTHSLSIGGGPDKALLYTYRLFIGAFRPTSGGGGDAVVHILPNGKLKLDNGSGSAGALYLGAGADWNGRATLNIHPGGIAEAVYGAIGTHSASLQSPWTANLNIDAGSLSFARDLTIGAASNTNTLGASSITLRNGGSLTVGNRLIAGLDATASLIEILPGSSLTTNYLFLGVSQNAAASSTLRISGLLKVRPSASTAFVTGTYNAASATSAINASTPIGGSTDVAIHLEPGGRLEFQTLQTGVARGGNHTFTMNGGEIVATSHIFLGSDNANASLAGISSNNLFTQNGGNVSLGGYLVVGSSNNKGARSRYVLNNGSLSITNPFVVGQHASDAAFVMENGTVTAQNILTVGQNGSSATLTQNGGCLTVSGAATIARTNATGSLVLNNGSLTANSTLDIANAPGSTGSLILNNGSLSALGQLRVGYGGNGTLLIRGGSLLVDNTFSVGTGNAPNDGSARVEMSGGVLRFTNTSSTPAYSTLSIAQSKSGPNPSEFILSGGDITHLKQLWIARSGAATRTRFLQTGGNLSANLTEIAQHSAAASGNLVLSGGVFTSNFLSLGRAALAGSNASLVVTGNASFNVPGILSAGTGSNASNSYSLNFDPAATAAVADNGGRASALFSGDSRSAIGRLVLSMNNPAVPSSATLSGNAQVSAASLEIADAASLVFDITGPADTAALLLATTPVNTAGQAAVTGNILVSLDAFAPSGGGTLSRVLLSHWDPSPLPPLAGRERFDATTAANLSNPAWLAERGIRSTPALSWQTAPLLPADAPSGHRHTLVLTLDFAAAPALDLPAEIAVNAGLPVTLSANATGAAPLSVEWRKTGSPEVLATGPSWSFTPSAADAGPHTVTASNAHGSASASFTLTVNPDTPPAFADNLPPALFIPAGSSASLTASVNGRHPLAFQWFKDGVAIPGATAPTLDLAANGSGAYHLTVTNDLGATSSATCVVTTAAPAAFLWVPSSGNAVTAPEMTLSSASKIQAAAHLPAADPDAALSEDNKPLPILLAPGETAEFACDLSVLPPAAPAAFSVLLAGSGGNLSNLILPGPAASAANPSVGSAGYGVRFSNTPSAAASLLRRRDNARDGGSNAPLLTADTNLRLPSALDLSPENASAALPTLSPGDTLRLRLSIKRLDPGTADLSASLSGGPIPTDAPILLHSTHTATDTDPAVHAFDTIAFALDPAGAAASLKISNITWSRDPVPDAAPIVLPRGDLTVLEGAPATFTASVRSETAFACALVKVVNGAETTVAQTAAGLSGLDDSAPWLGPIAGVSITLPAVTAADAGDYRLVVTNASGETRSDLFRLAVAPPPAFSVNTFFRDNAVLQRGEPIPVWGLGAPGATVTATLENAGSTVASASAVVDATGFWLVRIPAQPAIATPLALTVSDTAGGSFAFSNLLVGDLWLCGGQSNMNRELKYTSNYAADAADAVNWPNIRLYYATRASAAEPSETNTAPAWELLTPAQIANRTAIGYLFARTLAKTTHANIPIGILDLSRGGSPAQMWFQNGKLAALGYTDAARAAAASGSYYNAMIHPVRRVPLAGVLWYQGESNAYAPSSELHDLYYSLFPDLIRHWRDDVFNRPALPFYFVQLANYANDTDYVAVRDAQQQTLSLPNTGMALALDIGLEHDLHPPDKATVALRLALHAFKNNYNIPTLADGPRLADATVLPGQAAATLAFANTQNLTLLAQTLNATLPGPERPAFELAGPDGVFHLATAAVSAPDTLTVASPQVSEPKQVRYLWHNTPAALLYNRIPSPVPGEPAIWLPAPPIRPTPLRAVSFNDPASLAQDDLLAYALIPGPDGVLPETGGDLSHLPQTALSDGTLSLTFTPARAGFTYELQRSTDLQNWTTLHTITTPAALPVTLPADLPVATTPRQFLRLKITPPQK